ncbi:MAG: bacillithiol biosynthesis BshC, partial [Flavobacteriales bacterium]
MLLHRIAYAATQRFSPLVLDHAVGDPFLEAFREHAPTWDGVKAAAAGRRFGLAERAALVSAVRQQYEGLGLGGPVARSIDKLSQPDALTITTGHQLCLFLGPLYVPFKLLNAIRLAREAEERLKVPVVPVFWMATEDHDRAEVDHAWFGDRLLKWPGAAGGPVGRMRLDGIEAVVEQACAALGQGAGADGLRDVLRDCYRPERTLAEATRRFAHALFGRFGLVVVDGDDRALKRLFVP